jgi:hypothetical protein
MWRDYIQFVLINNVVIGFEFYFFMDMTLPCVNNTDNTSEDAQRYSLLESEPFDKFLVFKILQILLYCLAIYIYGL